MALKSDVVQVFALDTDELPQSTERWTVREPFWTTAIPWHHCLSSREHSKLSEIQLANTALV